MASPSPECELHPQGGQSGWVRLEEGISCCLLLCSNVVLDKGFALFLLWFQGVQQILFIVEAKANTMQDPLKKHLYRAGKELGSKVLSCNHDDLSSNPSYPDGNDRHL